ncbi:hypothetical protein DFH29DRAFT_1002135 [Suillus ampliporus]|nr:hypothetical protein DFH29DRAFT_1002135 [Suillus ampliporus]
MTQADEDSNPQISGSIISPTLNTARKPVQWEKAYSACTSRLIAWCKANKDAQIKLFSDSVKDAKEQGRKKKQSGIPKETYYLQLAHAVFENDEDPETRLLFEQSPQKYNDINKSLKQSGAGMTFDDLQKDPEMKTLLDSQLAKFLWWPDLHSWWRTNPAYNTVLSSVDPGQDFESSALQYFNASGSKDVQIPGENELDGEDNLLEDREIMDVDSTDICYNNVCAPSLFPHIVTPSHHHTITRPHPFTEA